jgi:hypothetical protein|tara:strand:+ start:3703 stop:3897 length:195 start_codon:yes stop_codon:yes gene_type:complete
MKTKDILIKIERFEYESMYDFYVDMSMRDDPTVDLDKIVALTKKLGQDKPYNEWVIPKEYQTPT